MICHLIYLNCLLLAFHLKSWSHFIAWYLQWNVHCFQLIWCIHQHILMYFNVFYSLHKHYNLVALFVALFVARCNFWMKIMTFIFECTFFLLWHCHQKPVINFFSFFHICYPSQHDSFRCSFAVAFIKSSLEKWLLGKLIYTSNKSLFLFCWKTINL